MSNKKPNIKFLAKFMVMLLAIFNRARIEEEKKSGKWHWIKVNKGDK